MEHWRDRRPLPAGTKADEDVSQLEREFRANEEMQRQKTNVYI